MACKESPTAVNEMESCSVKANRDSNIVALLLPFKIPKKARTDKKGNPKIFDHFPVFECNTAKFTVSKAKLIGWTCADPIICSEHGI